jgi:uncharacterized protein involved in type VI secretion and phage assembly
MYRETLLAFIERICAEEGIWTCYHHDGEGRHTLVFADEPTAIPVCPHQRVLDYNAMASGAVKGVYCSRLAWREQLRSTAYTQRDYTFKNPPYRQEHSERAPELNGVRNAYKLYDYPGRYKRDEAGRPFTRHKIEAVRVDASSGEGIANAPHLSAGYRFKLSGHPREEMNAKFLILSVRHSGRQPQALGADAAAPAAGGDPLDAFGLGGAGQGGMSGGAWPGSLAASLGFGLTGAGLNGAGTGARVAALGSLPAAAARHLALAGAPGALAGATAAKAEAGDSTGATLYANAFTSPGCPTCSGLQSKCGMLAIIANFCP